MLMFESWDVQLCSNRLALLVPFFILLFQCQHVNVNVVECGLWDVILSYQ